MAKEKPLTLRRLAASQAEPPEKLTAQIVFRETEQWFGRLEALARGKRRSPAMVARMVFRVGLLAVENARSEGIL